MSDAPKNRPPFGLNIAFEKAVQRNARTEPSEVAKAVADKESPLPLIEDGDTGDRFLVYATEDGVRIELQVDGDNFWATQRQMADAFGVTPQNVTMHLQNVFREWELSEALCNKAL